ncbi:MAG TPA: acyl carrier protein [Desulfobacterales bacterium]
MTESDSIVRARILQVLSAVAPEAQTGRLEEAEPFRNQFAFDSVDFLTFAIKLQQEFSLSIPEDDFPLLATLRGCVEYISARCAPFRP